MITEIVINLYASMLVFACTFLHAGKTYRGYRSIKAIEK